MKQNGACIHTGINYGPGAEISYNVIPNPSATYTLGSPTNNFIGSYQKIAYIQGNSQQLVFNPSDGPQIVLSAPTPAVDTINTLISVGSDANILLDKGQWTGTSALAGNYEFGNGLTVPTTSGTQSNFNYYEDTQTHTTDFTGPFTASDIVIKVQRVGNIVNLDIPDILGSVTVNMALTSSTALPVKWRPFSDKIYTLRLLDNATPSHGYLTVTSSGTIGINIFDGSGFTIVAGSNGFKSSSFSYSVV